MSELRLNLVTREWVIIASERSKRPHEFRRSNRTVHPPFLDTCPFCPGNEDLTSHEISRSPDTGPWLMRIIQNKYPALSSDGKKERRNEGIRHHVTGIGRHEVIIESPAHNDFIATMPHSRIADLIEAYRERFIDIYSDPRIEHVIIFKNHGEAAGTSLLHPHSQIIGTPVTPIQVRNRIEEGTRYFDNTGECLLCAMLRDELSDGRRIIVNTDHFACFIPYAALTPFHTWIFPKRHCATFGSITEEETTDLAYTLRTVLSKLYYGLENPDFNLIIRSENPKECASEYFHWYISIIPRVVQPAGFELGSGIYINTAIPEESAEFLRQIRPSPPLP